jgi:hypothetical protein
VYEKATTDPPAAEHGGHGEQHTARILNVLVFLKKAMV